MEDVFCADFVSLHVRVTNRVAYHMYTESLKYEIHDTDLKYYANGEDAYEMRKFFKEKKAGKGSKGSKQEQVSEVVPS